MRLKEKVALIGGAGSNMSRAAALLFAQEGANIVLAARTTRAMEETAAQIRANGGAVLTHQTDLADTVQVDTLINAAVAEFGGIDCIIHAAGGFFSTAHDIVAMEPTYWDGALKKQFANLFQPCAESYSDFRRTRLWMPYYDISRRTRPARCEYGLCCCESWDGCGREELGERTVREEHPRACIMSRHYLGAAARRANRALRAPVRTTRQSD